MNRLSKVSACGILVLLLTIATACSSNSQIKTEHGSFVIEQVEVSTRTEAEFDSREGAFALAELQYVTIVLARPGGKSVEDDAADYISTFSEAVLVDEHGEKVAASLKGDVRDGPVLVFRLPGSTRLAGLSLLWPGNDPVELADYLLESPVADAMGIQAGEELLDAAEEGDTEKVKSLLEQGADVNTRNQSGWTPLHVAAWEGNLDTARLLIERGADVNARCEWDGTPVHFAAIEGQTEMARLLIERGADVDARSGSDRTPLHVAAHEGHTETAELLIEHGADVNARDQDDWTPLHDAALNGSTETAELLIEHGAAVNARDQDDQTPLHFAAREGHTETADLLRQHGAVE